MVNASSEISPEDKKSLNTHFPGWHKPVDSPKTFRVEALGQENAQKMRRLLGLISHSPLSHVVELSECAIVKVSKIDGDSIYVDFLHSTSDLDGENTHGAVSLSALGLAQVSEGDILDIMCIREEDGSERMQATKRSRPSVSFPPKERQDEIGREVADSLGGQNEPDDAF